MGKNLVARNYTWCDYDFWFIYEKWWYLQPCFPFFKNFDFLGQKGSKRSKKNKESLPILQWDTMIKVGFRYLIFYYYLFICLFLSFTDRKLLTVTKHCWNSGGFCSWEDKIHEIFIVIFFEICLIFSIFLFCSSPLLLLRNWSV